MAVTTRIKEDQLSAYFDQFTKRFLRDDAPEFANVEVLSPDWGDQFESEGSPLIGITFEPKENTLTFELESGDHRLYSPREVWVLEDKDGFVGAVEVIRQDGRKEVVTIRRAALR